jgi:hypothetical protein
MFRTLALILLLTGIIFVTIGYTKMSFKCPNAGKIEYRYIPRQIYEEQIYDQNIMNKFGSMFDKESPNTKSYGDTKTKTDENTENSENEMIL